MRKDRTRHKPADPYQKAPKVNHKIDRRCLGLGCGVTFIAETKYIRLCDLCRKKDH